MARKQRIHYEGALYHIIARGNNKGYIFKCDEDKDLYLEKVFTYVEKYGGRLYAYVIMDNHCHLLIEAGDLPVSKIMQLIQQTYTSAYNRKYKHSGHVFEQRFKSILCEKDAYLLALVRYIHQNPVRAQIGELDYAYSSHKLYMNYDSKHCSVAEVLGLFSANKKKAIQLYYAFVSKADDVIKDLADRQMAPEFYEIEEKLYKISIEKKDSRLIIEAFERKNGISLELLKGKYLAHDLVLYRKTFVREMLRCGAMTQVEISKMLEISESYVSRIFNSGE